MTAYHDTGTTKNVRYYYKLVAVNAVGNSPAAAEVSAVAK